MYYFKDQFVHRRRLNESGGLVHGSVPTSAPATWQKPGRPGYDLPPGGDLQAQQKFMMFRRAVQNLERMYIDDLTGDPAFGPVYDAYDKLCIAIDQYARSGH